MAVSAPATHAQTLLDLEARHDELFRLLDELEKRVARVLAEYQPARQGDGNSLAGQDTRAERP